GQNRLGQTTAHLTHFGFECKAFESEATLMWSKLVILAPFALATTAAAAPVGAVLKDPARGERLLACVRECCAVAVASGAGVDATKMVEAFTRFPYEMRSSMQKDVAAGRPPELDAIAGPVLTGGAAHGIPLPATSALVEAVKRRLAGSAP